MNVFCQSFLGQMLNKEAKPLKSPVILAIEVTSDQHEFTHSPNATECKYTIETTMYFVRNSIFIYKFGVII